jgi:hypothetical protein
MYVQLARVSAMRGRLYVQDRLLLCAALIAAQVEMPKTAAQCRERILRHNPQHWIGKFATIAAAIADDDSLGLIRQTQRRYPPERAEQLYSTLGLSLEEERARHVSSAAFLASTLGTSLFEIDDNA